MTDACPINAAKLYLQGAGPWRLDEIGINGDDYLVQCFTRYRDALIERCATIAEQYEHAWGEGNNPICGLIAADIRALKDRAALQEQSK